MAKGEGTGQDEVAMSRPTLSDVAAAAGVSRSAAARVLLGTGGEQVRVSEATQERIQAAAKKLRYVPNRLAQQLRGAPSRTIGVMVESTNMPVMSQRLFALENAASLAGYRLLVGQIHGQDETLQAYVADFTGRGVEAIFCLFDLVPGRDERLRAAFGKYRKVVFHGRPAWKGGCAIRVDTEAALAACVDHLVESGKKFPALSLWNGQNDELMALRQSGFLQQLKKRGRKGFVWDAAPFGSVPSPEVLDHGIDEMVKKKGADAIIASNDVWATRFVLHLVRSGLRVPEDVAVIGYDNLDIAEVVTPALTTVDQDHEVYAELALRLLLDLAEGREILSAKRVLTVAPRLIIRGSSARR